MVVVSWSIGTRPDAELVNTMLDAAVETVADSKIRPIVHSDRGAHYRWPGWLARMGDAGLICVFQPIVGGISDERGSCFRLIVDDVSA